MDNQPITESPQEGEPGPQARHENTENDIENNQIMTSPKHDVDDDNNIHPVVLNSVDSIYKSVIADLPKDTEPYINNINPEGTALEKCVTLTETQNDEQGMILSNNNCDHTHSTQSQTNSVAEDAPPTEEETKPNVTEVLVADIDIKQEPLDEGYYRVELLHRGGPIVAYSDDDDTSSSSDASEPPVIKCLDEGISDDEDEHAKANSIKFRSRTFGEVFPEELPPLEYMTISPDESVELEPLGVISGIVDTLVVVKANNNCPALYDDTILFVDGRKPLGLIFETFGTVEKPYYSVRFNSAEDIKERDLEVGQTVFFAPKADNLTKYVFIAELRKIKCDDSSWKNDNETPASHRDYSDDEEERKEKRRAKNKNRTPDGQETTADSEEPFKRKRKPLNKRNRDRFPPVPEPCQPRLLPGELNRNPFGTEGQMFSAPTENNWMNQQANGDNVRGPRPSFNQQRPTGNTSFGQAPRWQSRPNFSAPPPFSSPPPPAMFATSTPFPLPTTQSQQPLANPPQSFTLPPPNFASFGQQPSSFPPSQFAPFPPPPSFRPNTQQVPSFTSGNQAPSFNFNSQSSSFNPRSQTPSFNSGSQAPSFNSGSQAPSFSPSTQLPSQWPSSVLGLPQQQHQQQFPTPQRPVAGFPPNNMSPHPTQFGVQGAQPTQFNGQGAQPTQFRVQGAQPTQFGVQGAQPTQFGVQGAQPTQFGVQGAQPTQFNGQGVQSTQFNGQGVQSTQFNGQGVQPTQFNGQGVQSQSFSVQGVTQQPFSGFNQFQQAPPGHN